MARDKWKPSELNKKEIYKKLSTVSFLCKRLETGIGYNSILVDIDYDQMMNLVAELYNDMDLESLALDAKRRSEEVRKQVEANEKK